VSRTDLTPFPALPFSDEVFSAGVSLNALDCVWSPYDHLKELARILMPDSRAIVSTPYDWAANATPCRIMAWRPFAKVEA